MKKLKVLTLVGGISRNSLNKKLFRGIQDRNLEGFEFLNYDISKLPYFSQDIEMDPPDTVVEFKDLIRASDAVLFITPEYNRSFPGVLKNAIDWGSRPYGSNLWDGKIGAVMGASSGNIGTFGAQHHLRQVLSYLNISMLNQPEFYFNGSKAFDEDGVLVNEQTKEIIQGFFDKFHELIISATEDQFENESNQSSFESHQLQQ